MTTPTLKHLRTPVLAAALGAAVLAPGALAGQAAATRPLPFAPGEACVYRASGPLGRIGSGTMSVEDAGTSAGRQTWLLRFEFRGRMGPMTAEDHTRSWFDPRAVASVRYTKRERSPLTSTNQDVTMDLAAGRWREPGGRSGPLASAAPLDELSFLYYLRTLPLADGETHTLTRHYEVDRNPVGVRVVERRALRVPAGEFHTVVVEMRVRDPERYGETGLVRLYLSDDARRILVRMDSAVPRVGRVTLALQETSERCAPSTGAIAAR
jgi:hypothetical protein